MPRLRKAKLSNKHPVRVTVSMLPGLNPLRRQREYAVLLRCFEGGRDRVGFRLVQYCVQDSQLHLVVEAQDRSALSNGLQGLFVRIARGLNRLWQRKGIVFADRYEDFVLHNPKEVRDALAFVLNNARLHNLKLEQPLDSYSSAASFDGWKEKPSISVVGIDDIPVTQARTWLLTKGWRKQGLISIHEIPGR